MRNRTSGPLGQLLLQRERGRGSFTELPMPNITVGLSKLAIYGSDCKYMEGIRKPVRILQDPEPDGDTRVIGGLDLTRLGDDEATD